MLLAAVDGQMTTVSAGDHRHDPGGAVLADDARPSHDVHSGFRSVCGSAGLATWTICNRATVLEAGSLQVS